MDTPESAAIPLPARVQPLIATVVAACLAAAGIWFLRSGGLVHHDRPPALDNRYTVNANTADEVELSQLPGIGPAMARRIVDHRREHGPFTSVDGLLDVPGIGRATFEAMRPHLRPIHRTKRTAPHP